MADFTADNVLFGSSFDSTGFVAGITKSIDGLKSLSAEQKKLQAVFKETNSKLFENTIEIGKTERAYSNLNKGSKTYIEDQNKLKSKIDELKATSVQLNAAWFAQRAQLDAFNASNNTAVTSFNKLNTAQKEVAATASKPIVPTLDSTQVTGQLQNMHDLLQGAGGKVEFSGFEELTGELSAAGNEIEQLNIVLDVAKEKLATLDPDTKEFEDLNEVVQTGEKFLNDYNATLTEVGKTEDATGEKTVSMRTRIKLLREELTRLEDQGLENTEVFKKTQLEAARLTDQFEDQQKAIKVLASDTKALDFGLAAVNAAGAGMQVYLGALNLFGLSEEKAAEAQRKLLAVMNLVQGAQQLQNLLLKEGTIVTLGSAAATRVYAAVNGFLATSFGAAATAATAFRGALITTGIGALVVGLGFLIAKLVEWQKEAAKTAAKQKLLTDTLEESKGEYTKAVVEVDTFKEHLRLAKEGVIDKAEVLKEYNEGLGKTMGAVNDLDAAEKKVAEGGAAYIQFTLLKAAANIALGKAAEKAFEAEQERRKSELEFATTGNKILTNIKIGGTGIGSFSQTQEEIAKNQEDLAKQRKAAAIKEKQEAEKDLTDLVKSLNDQASELAKQFHFNFIPKVKVDKKAAKKEVDDVFKEQLLALQAQLADINKATFVNPQTIAAKVEADYNKARERILDFFKKKQLTVSERDTLLEFLGVIKAAQLSKDMAEFTKNVVEARKKLQDELDSLAFAQSTRNINNIQDQFERENQLNQLELKRQTDDLIRANDEQVKQIRDNIFISEDEKTAAIAEHTRNLNDQLLALQIKYGNEQRDLALEILDQAIDDIERTFNERDLRTSELEQQQIKALSQQFVNGEITYQNYQDRLTKINTEAKAKRDANDIIGIKEQIRILQDLVDSETITDKTGVVRKLNEDEIKKLKEQIIELREQLLALGQIPITNPNPDTSGLDEWLTAYKGLTEGILGFIQQIDDAEQARLERSIALQQTRVENARSIAEKGNAEYLELEQKRLDALIAKREAAANKELAINNALAASGAIVAAIQALAGGDAVTGIAKALAILAAIGAIYKFVSSLQPPVAEFYEGTTYVERGRNKPGKDTIPARLTEGEAVIPVDTNEAYNPAVKAIYERSIPAKEINDFVEHYRVKKVEKEDVVLKTVHERFVTDNVSKKSNVENSISTKVLNQFIKKHLSEQTSIKREHDVTKEHISDIKIKQIEYANILKEFVKQSDVKRVSVNVLNEFVKQHLSKKEDLRREDTRHKDVTRERKSDLKTKQDVKHDSTTDKTFIEFVNRYQDIKNITNADINKEYQPAIKVIQERSIPAQVLNNFIQQYAGAKTSNTWNDFIKQYPTARTELQKDYKEIIKTISLHPTPVKVLNDFVAHYPVTKIPQIDYGRLHVATERSYQKDFSRETNTKLDKVTDLLSTLNENVSQFDNVKMTFDEHGFAVSMLQAAKKQKLKWRS